MRRRGDGVFAVVFMELPSIEELGPQYRSIESGIAIPVELESGRTGSTWAVMFVDNDIAQVAGREVWGHPKKLADVRVELTGPACSGEVRHLPYRDPERRLLYRVEAAIDGSHLEVAELAADLGGRFQRRLLPGPFDDDGGSDDLVRVIVSDVVLHSEGTGSARIDLHESDERLDELGPLEVLGAHHRVADFVLRRGKPVG
jgi:acetoacetate decarboxylase